MLIFLIFHLQQSDQCSVDKYAFEDEGTIQYDASIPKMEQFTLCAWMRFTNHNGDHSIFTYSGKSYIIDEWRINDIYSFAPNIVEKMCIDSKQFIAQNGNPICMHLFKCTHTHTHTCLSVECS